MTLLRWAWDNLFQLSLIVSPAVTLCALAFWSQVPSRRELKLVGRRVDQVERTAAAGGIAMEKRIIRLEEQMSTLATKADVQEVLLALARQDGQRSALEAKLDGVGQRVAGMERPLDIIQEHLLRESRR